jgi:hypothetical protein
MITDDANVAKELAHRRICWTNRERGLRDEAGYTHQRRDDGSSRAVRRVHGAWSWSARRLVMHRAHHTGFVSARAFLLVRSRCGEA